jgi:hypothetical protein
MFRPFPRQGEDHLPFQRGERGVQEDEDVGHSVERSVSSRVVRARSRAIMAARPTATVASVSAKVDSISAA